MSGENGSGGERAVAAAALVGAGAVAAAGKLGWDRASEHRARARAERAFQLHRGEPMAPGIRRIARAQIEEAAERLRDPRDPGAAVHGARKNFKRLRSTLRLVAGPLDADTRAAENRAIRDAGRRLSSARDRQVMLETFDDLELKADSFRAHLQAEHERAQRELKHDQAQLRDVAAALHEAELRVDDWAFKSGGRKPEQLAPGLQRIYARGQKDMRRARREPTAEHMHEWRKRAKDLWYGTQILHPVHPKRMKRLAERAHHLADLLGDDHDLAVLREEVLAHAVAFSDPAELERVVSAIELRSAELRREAFATGEKLYRRKPARWTKRLVRG